MNSAMGPGTTYPRQEPYPGPSGYGANLPPTSEQVPAAATYWSPSGNNGAFGTSEKGKGNFCSLFKNKTNHPMYSNSLRSATADKSKN